MVVDTVDCLYDGMDVSYWKATGGDKSSDGVVFGWLSFLFSMLILFGRYP